MLSERSIKEYALKMQTTEVNAAREYFQHVFLSRLYSLPGSEKLAFKGGTALRIIFASPRFSEDLDFTSTLKEYHAGELLKKAVKMTEEENIPVKIEESKPTSGGYLAMYRAEILTYSIGAEINISTRKTRDPFKTETRLVAPAIHPAYTAVILDENILVSEKIQALLARKKPRDYFGLYYIVQNRLAIRSVIPYKKKILEALAQVKNEHLAKELKLFLPKSYWNLLPNLLSPLKKAVSAL
jgi:predicted nucleotidyltransferase component of viral defense system